VRYCGDCEAFLRIEKSNFRGSKIIIKMDFDKNYSDHP
jgi:hypothetical protein